MKFYRFMSMKEFNKMSSGVDIVGKKSFKARTTSTGVCFLSEHTLCKDDEHKATINVEKAYDFLYGIVSDDIVVEFEARQEMTESYGVYASIFIYSGGKILNFFFHSFQNSFIIVFTFK